MQAVSMIPGRIHANRGTLTLALILVAAAYFVAAFTGQALRARDLRSDIAEHQATLERINTENALLQAQVDRYATDSYFTYVQQRARRDLLLANEGETLVLVNWDRVEAPAPANPTPAATEKVPNWKRWLEVFDRR